MIQEGNNKKSETEDRKLEDKSDETGTGDVDLKHKHPERSDDKPDCSKVFCDL